MLNFDTVKVDSVARKVHALEIKTDSLQKLVNETHIASGFFSEIIALQLGIFIVLIGLGGWISWTQIAKQLRLDRESILNKTNLIFQEQSLNFNRTITDLTQSINKTRFNVNASLYNQYVNTNDEYAFLWGLSCATSYSVYKPTNLKETIEWLTIAKQHLEKLNSSHLKTQENVATRLEDEHYRILESLENVEVTSLVNEVRQKANVIIYSNV